MWALMVRNLDDNTDELVCIHESKQEAIEIWFGDDIEVDDMGREPLVEQAFTHVRYYLMEIDENRSSLIKSLLDDCLTNYKFENRW